MNAPLVIIALHDGYFSAGTGAGRSNRALIQTVAAALAPGVELALLPVLLHPTSDEYDRPGHRALQEQLKTVPHRIIPLDNGTAGMRRFGDLANFEQLNHHGATILNQLMDRHPRGLLIAIDQPFAGLGRLLTAPSTWQLLYLPRSSADHHDQPQRARWEQHGLAGWTAAGAHVGAISTHMRTLLTTKGIPAERIIDIPGGLTAADDTPLDAAPPLPPAAADGFLLAMGRAQPYKGFEDLLLAASLLRDQGHPLPHLLLAAVTDGPLTPYQQHLRNLGTELGLSATLWTRFDPGIPGLLHHPALRAVIVPSRTEPLGRIPLEAFAAGAGPVVATTAGGLAETVVEGITGFSAPPSDPPALAAALLRALTAAPQTLARMASTGAELVAARDYTSCVTGAVASLAPWATASAAANP